MDFARVELNDDDQAFLHEVRAFLRTHVTEEVVRRDRETGDNFDEDVHLAVGARGYLAADWQPESDGGFSPVTTGFEADDHKAYYPGSHKIAMRFTGDRATGRLLGVQLFGHKHAEVAKRIDIAATAVYCGLTVDQVSDLDLSYTPPLGSPWDAVQQGAQAWTSRPGPG